MFRRRKRASKRFDKKVFTHTASKVHPKNLRLFPMRGGIRV